MQILKEYYSFNIYFININQFFIREQYSLIKNHIVIKIHLNTLLDIKLPQMDEYAKYFDKNSKYMNLSVNDKEILEKYNKIWCRLK